MRGEVVELEGIPQRGQVQRRRRRLQADPPAPAITLCGDPRQRAGMVRVPGLGQPGRVTPQIRLELREVFLPHLDSALVRHQRQRAQPGDRALHAHVRQRLGQEALEVGVGLGLEHARRIEQRGLQVLHQIRFRHRPGHGLPLSPAPASTRRPWPAPRPPPPARPAARANPRAGSPGPAWPTEAWWSRQPAHPQRPGPGPPAASRSPARSARPGWP